MLHWAYLQRWCNPRVYEMVGRAMRDDETLIALAALGYDHEWWQYGFVDELALASQFALLSAGTDTNIEHYRYGRFLHILETHAALDERGLARFVELATVDSEQVMAESALIRLVHWSGLTTAQRDWLRQQPALASPVVQRAFTRIARREGR